MDNGGTSENTRKICPSAVIADNRNRYLFFLLKNGDYNFSTKDASVYNLYSSFCASIKDMKYAAILE